MVAWCVDGEVEMEVPARVREVMDRAGRELPRGETVRLSGSPVWLRLAQNE
jgi:hypothetical protein